MSLYALAMPPQYWGGRNMQFDAASKAEARRNARGQRMLYSRPADGRVAVIPVKGSLTDDWSPYGPYGGATGYNYISTALRVARRDGDVSAIVLRINSPGGTVSMLPELADEIRRGNASSGGKPVYAAIDGLGASAAYWIASAADIVTLSPSGDAGSIGVWTAHVDESGFWRMLGLNYTLISSGAHKVDGHPFGPLGEDVMAEMQASVDDLRQQFAASVAKNRKKDMAEIMATEARIYPATSSSGRETAQNAGLVDVIAPTDQVIAELIALTKR